MINLLILDKNELIREALGSILVAKEGFKIIASTPMPDEALRLLITAKPDVVITSHLWGHHASVYLMHKAIEKNIDIPFIFFIDPSCCSYSEVQQIFKNSIIRGILSFSASSGEIKAAIRQVYQGSSFIDIDFKNQFLLNGLNGDQESFLSIRQLQVLRMIASGYTYNRIAVELGITNDTVKTHVRLLLKKLNAHDRAHAVSQAYRLGILKAD